MTYKDSEKDLFLRSMDSRILRLSLSKAIRAMADLVMPRICVVCGRDLLLVENHICTECEAELPLTHFSRQRDNPMAEAFNSMIQREIEAGEEGFEPFSYATALIYYSGSSAYKNIPRELKYGRNFSEGRHFAKMLGRELASSALFADVDVIVPVPLHWVRRWKRGYNQAEVIAKSVAREMGGISVRSGLVRRVRYTKTQTKLHKSKRYSNVENAFVAKRCSPAPKHILLVDDVFTTGSTLCACERALRKVFPAETRISAATLAFVKE